MGRKDIGTHIPCLPPPPPAVGDFQSEAPAGKALPARPARPPPGAGLCFRWEPPTNCSHSGKGLLCPPWLPCQGPEGLWASVTPQLLVAGHSLTQPDGYGGVGRAPVPPSAFPAPEGRERGGAISAHRQRQSWVTFTVSSFQTAKLGWTAPGRRCDPSVPSTWVQRGREHVSCQRRQGGRQRAGAKVEGLGRKETGEKLLMKELKAGGMALSKPLP